MLVIKECFDALIVMQNRTVALLECFFIFRNEVPKLTVNPLGFYISYADNKHKYTINLIFVVKEILSERKWKIQNRV